MGIRGLTTFINNRSHLYLKYHELHDCDVVIDGNSLASTLYKWHCKSNDCFGGDYDKFANVIRNFFNTLSQCSVTPYVILDGGYEKRKLNTVITRMRNKIRAAEALNAITEGSESVFPLFLREVFVDVVLSLGVKVARCDFEGDMEIAGIAQALECPVISYDSDFYIFGCLYIPFSTVELTIRKGKGKAIKTSYNYLVCKIYHIEDFLQAFGGLDRSNLPLLAVLLGNDYINGGLFSPFYRNLKMQKCSGTQSDQQKRIKSVIVWLQNEDIESGIQKILSRFKGPRRRMVLKKIRASMKGYFNVNSELLRYLDIEPTKRLVDLDLDFDKLNEQAEVSVEDNDKPDSESENEGSKNTSENEDDILEELEDDLEDDSMVSKLFIKNYRNCQYPACFMDMMTWNRYYCIPQVEDGSSKHSHEISLDILGILFKILTPDSQKNLKVVCRGGRVALRHFYLQRPVLEVPTLEGIEKLSLEECRITLLDFLSIDNKFREVLQEFPVDWHLFLLSLKYAIDKGHFDAAIVNSSAVCFIILNYVDTKVGFYRVSKTFEKKFASALLKIKSENAKPSKFQSFADFSFKDCLVCMDKMISYFQMDAKLKANYRLYDKTLVHSLSQLQSVFLHVRFLNSILNNPFPIFEIHKIFDGTFLYNMTVTLRKRTNISEYLDMFLKDSPSVLGGINQTLDKLKQFLSDTVILAQPIQKRKRKKKKKSENHIENSDEIEEDEDKDAIIDPNNLYSILAVM